MWTRTVEVFVASLAVAAGLTETFDAGAPERWELTKGSWAFDAGEWYADAAANAGLRVASPASFQAASTTWAAPTSTVEQDFVLQVTVKHAAYEPGFCGGGYVKVMDRSTSQATFDGDTPYRVMFGPDQCGHQQRVRLLWEHGGAYLERRVAIPMPHVDAFTHLYTLHLRADQTYTVYVDNVDVASGSLLADWPFPPEEIDDPSDTKPSDWVDEETVPDPESTKPSDWVDGPLTVPDPTATKPDAWDDDDDGEWAAPSVANPAYRGAWTQASVPNPDYVGVWAPSRVPNPDFAPQVAQYDDLGVLGIDIWTVQADTVFDNLWLGSSLDSARAFAEHTFAPYVQAERDQSVPPSDATDDTESAATTPSEPDVPLDDAAPPSDATDDTESAATTPTENKQQHIEL